MKKVLSLLFLYLLSYSHVQAQTETHTHSILVEEGKMWTYKKVHPLPPEEYREWHESSFLQGDTIIGGYKCLKLFSNSDNPLNSYENLFSGAMFEEDEKVYYIPPGNSTPWMIYDFSCQSGDTVIFKDIPLVMRKHMEIDYNGIARSVLYMSPHDIDRQVIWIEGIGCNKGLIDYDDVWAPGGGYTVLEACMIGDEIVYEKSLFEETIQDALSCHPPIDSGKKNSSYHANSWYDITGRSLTLPMKHRGIYIQNGRKVVVR